MSIFETIFQLNGVNVRPKNATSLGFVFDFTGDEIEAELGTDQVVLEGQAKQLVLDHIDSYGAFEGVPFTVKVKQITLDYYISFKENPLISGFGDSDLNLTIVRRYGVESYIKKINGLSFRDVNRTHPFTLLEVPYLIVKDNQLEMLLMLSISTFTLVKALVEGIQGITEVISGGVAAFTPIPSVPVPTSNIGAIIGYVLTILAYVVYLAAITLALIDLTKQIMELLFPPIRYLKACTVRELLDNSLDSIGLSFSSTIIDEYEAMTLLPVPFRSDNDYFTSLFTLDNGSYTLGYPTDRDTTPLVGDLFNVLEGWFNAEKKVIGTTLYLERWDFWQDQATLTILNTLNLQGKRENQYTYNMGEAWKRYYMKWRLDTSDIHTLDQIDKTSTEYTTLPINVQNADLVEIDGVVTHEFAFAIGVRKGSLSFIEEAALPFAQLADDVVEFFGGDGGYVAMIQGRIGVTQISQQYYSSSKMLYAINGRQPENYLDIIGADAIYQAYHTINQVKENFQRIYKATIPFSTSNFLEILNNNYVFDDQGQSLKVLRFEWTNESKEADIEYSQHSSEGGNTKTVRIA